MLCVAESHKERLPSVVASPKRGSVMASGLANTGSTGRLRLAPLGLPPVSQAVGRAKAIFQQDFLLARQSDGMVMAQQGRPEGALDGSASTDPTHR